MVYINIYINDNMNDLELYDIAINSAQEISSFSDNNFQSDIPYPTLNMNVDNKNYKILQNTAIIISSKDTSIQEKIASVSSAMKKHFPSIDIIKIDDIKQIYRLKPSIVIMPSDAFIDKNSSILSPSVKIYSEKHYKENPEKKLKTWNFILNAIKR